MRLKSGLIPSLLLLISAVRAQDSLELKYKGAAWLQAGRVMHSTDSLVNGGSINNMNGNPIWAAGVAITSLAKFSPNWEGGLGMGLVQGHNARGDIGVANNWYPTWGPFISEARVTYNQAFSETHKLQMNLGFFNYNYNPEAKNLGVYLLRGYAYPATPISGFEARHTTASSNLTGAMLGYTFGSFKNDLLLISETENRPYFDLSVADVVTWTPGPAFQLGAGVNFYRAIPRNKDLTTLDRSCVNQVGSYSNISQVDGEVCWTLDTLSVDSTAGTAVVDTIFNSLQGTKLMGRFRFDPKALFGLGGSLGKQDLVLYGEVGLFGVTNYKKYYEKRSERMPIMLGFNLPAFNFLDKLCIEVEYYTSKNFPDYGKGENYFSAVPRPVPGIDNTRDDFKWSLYFSKAVLGHLRLSGQVANDHMRMFGPPDLGYVSYAEGFTSSKDWYWMLKSTYFF